MYVKLSLITAKHLSSRLQVNHIICKVVC